MNTKEHKKLEQDIYDTANKIVGHVESMDKIFARDFVELIVSFIIYRDILDTDEIMETWTKWINGYCIFTKYSVPDGLPIMEDPKLVIRWAALPRVRENGWKWGEELIPFPKKYRVEAYLAITRVDYDYKEPLEEDVGYTLTLGREIIHHFFQ